MRSLFDRPLKEYTEFMMSILSLYMKIKHKSEDIESIASNINTAYSNMIIYEPRIFLHNPQAKLTKAFKTKLRMSKEFIRDCIGCSKLDRVLCLSLTVQKPTSYHIYSNYLCTFVSDEYTPGLSDRNVACVNFFLMFNLLFVFALLLVYSLSSHSVLHPSHKHKHTQTHNQSIPVLSGLL